MKTLFLFTLTLTLSLTLNARENPFAATNAYEEEAARIIESNEYDLSTINDQEYIQEMQEQMSMMPNANKNKVEKAVQVLIPAIKEKEEKKPEAPKSYSKTEVNKLIKKVKQETTQLVEKKLKSANVEPTQIVYVKPRTDVIEDNPITTKTILPFLTLNYDNKQLTLESKYNVIKKFTIDKENKLIIDYKAKVNFYTKREKLKSKNYNKITVGNHKNERYFRVVIQLEEKPSKYIVSYEDKLISVKINKL